MSVVPEAESTHQPAKSVNTPSTFNIYPVLGIALIFVLAAMVYGALLIFLLEQ